MRGRKKEVNEQTPFFQKNRHQDGWRLKSQKLEVRFDEGVERSLVAHTRALSNGFAILEGDDRRDTANVVFTSKAVGFVAVVLSDHGTTVERLSGLFKTRGEHTARTAPGGPEVNENRGVGLGNDVFEVVVIHVDDFAHGYSR